MAALAFYENFQKAYDFYNEKLFNNELEDALIGFQRKTRTFGYISYNRLNVIGKETYVHELALNPDYFAYRTLIETLSTLVHEQTHLYQHMKGTDSRKTYHNEEFSRLMFERGLQTSHTGEEDGKKVGQQMSHYILPDGLFLECTLEFLKDGSFYSFYDRVTPKYIEPIQFYDRSIKFIKRMEGRISVEDIIPPYLFNHIKENPYVLQAISGIEGDLGKEDDGVIAGQAASEDDQVDGEPVNGGGEPVEDEAGEDNEDEEDLVVVEGENTALEVEKQEKEDSPQTQVLKTEDIGIQEIVKAVASPEMLIAPLQDLTASRSLEINLTKAVRVATTSSSKHKFQCKQCNTNLWGKPSLNVVCGDCDLPFELVE